MATPAARVLVIQHADECPPALAGEWLRERGCELEVRRPEIGTLVPDVTAYDGFLVLGGPMGANDDETVSWLAPVKEQVRRADVHGVPTLGLCLGHQILAVALGGEVGVNPRGQQVGLVEIGWAETAAEDPLVGGLAGAGRVVHWNNDLVLHAPTGSAVLAETPEGELQAARFGDRMWGVQGHPEVDVDVVRPWAAWDRVVHEQRGIDQDEVLGAIDDAAAELEQSWRPVVQQWAAMLTVDR